jgi:hypothetical protein
MINRDEVGPELARQVRAASVGPDVSDAVRIESGSWPGPGALQERRSHRVFASRGVPESALVDIVETGMAMDRVLWRNDVRPLAVTVLTSQGIGHVLDRRLVYSGQKAPDFADLVAQPELATAPALLIVSADLVAALREHGPRGYRELLVRAGQAVGACLLRATELGVVGCVFDGLLPPGRLGIDGIDGVRRISLVAASLGHSPSTEGPPS